MAWLAVVVSHKVNGVSELHSRLMVESLFADFARIFPRRFTNVTNGVTPRRWLAAANPALSGVLDRYIGQTWRTDLSQLSELGEYQDYPLVNGRPAKPSWRISSGWPTTSPASWAWWSTRRCLMCKLSVFMNTSAS
jgi:glucan phosphorylase